MSDAKTLHDEDFVAWSKEQADALRAAARGGSNQALDWENLAEEIEDLGVSQKSALDSQIRRIVRHLLKLENSPAIEPRRGWIESVDDARTEIEYLLEKSPSLATYLDNALANETRRAVNAAIRDLDRHGEADPVIVARIRATAYSPEQILGDWLPPEPPA